MSSRSPTAWIERPVFSEMVGFLVGFVISMAMGILAHEIVHGDGYTWQEILLPGLLTGFLAALAAHLARRNLEKNRARAMDLFARAFRMSPALSAITDLETERHLDVNETWLRTLGFTREEAIGKTAKELGHWYDYESRERLIAILQEEGSVRRFEARLKGKDGSFHDILMDCDIMQSNDGRQVMWSGHDVTGRKESLRTLNLFHEVMAGSQDAIFISNLEDGTFVEINGKACRSLGYEREELLRLSVLDIDAEVTTPEIWRKHLETLKESGGGSVIRSTYRRKDGSTFPVEIGIRLVTFEDHTYNVAVSRDISETLRSETELKRARDAAEYANHLKTQFLANMSHELRTPLNAIIGFADILKSEMFGPLGNDRYKEYARDISDSGGHLLNVITDVLDVSRIEAGTLDFREEDVNVERTVISCLRLMQRRADEAELTLHSEVPDNLPALWADQLRVKQVVINLLSNAIKFTQPGGSVTVDAGIAENGTMWISVSDTGIGMMPDDIPRALEPFGQVGDLMTHPHEGSGLGLYIVKSLIESHAGKVEIESAPQTGTTVTARFPKARVKRR